jgi:hypothetical protein
MANQDNQKNQEKQEKQEKFDNFDDFMQASGIDRDDVGKLPEKYDDIARASDYDIPVYDEFESFWHLFPKMSADWSVIKNFIRFPDDLYERVIGICMLIMVAAACSPILSIAYAMFATEASEAFGTYYLYFSFGLTIFFLFSVLVGKMSFWLPMVAIIVLLKFLVFDVSRTDAYMASAMFLTIYLMYRKKREK